MKLPFFPKRPETHDKWWNRLMEVFAIGVSALLLFIGILTAIANEEIAPLLAFILFASISYLLIVGLYQAALYVLLGPQNAKNRPTENVRTPTISRDKQPSATSIVSPKKKVKWLLHVDSEEGAKLAVKEGYIAAYIVAGLTGLIALISLSQGTPIGGIDEWAIVDALIMAAAGIGIQFYSRIAAVGALVIFAIGKIVSISEAFAGGQDPKPAGLFVAFFIFLALLNGVRGTFAYQHFQRVGKYAHQN